MNSTVRLSSKSAFTLVELIVILAAAAILVAVLLPVLHSPQRKSQSPAKQPAQLINCVSNLKQVGLAFRLWEGDNGDKYPMAVSTNKNGTMEYAGDVFRHFQVMSNELNTPKILVCPADDRTPAASYAGLENQNVSYFVGLDAKETRPQMLMTGDRNVTNGIAPEHGILKLVPDQPAGWTETMHNGKGNVGMADGSVQQCTIPGLQQMLKKTGDSTNRIALPE